MFGNYGKLCISTKLAADSSSESSEHLQPLLIRESVGSKSVVCFRIVINIIRNNGSAVSEASRVLLFALATSIRSEQLYLTADLEFEKCLS